MKIFANKSIWKKIVLILLLLTVFNFVAPEPVAAGIGGELMDPICDFLVWLGDGVVNIIHKAVLKQPATLVKIDLSKNIGEILGIALIIVVVIATAIALTVVSGGLLSGALVEAGFSVFGAAILTGAVKAVTITVGASLVFAGVSVYSSDKWGDDLEIPIYSISPEEIFKNEIPVFNVNFFNPDKRTVEYKWTSKDDYKEIKKFSWSTGYYKDPKSQMNEYFDEKGFTIDGEKLTVDVFQQKGKLTEKKTENYGVAAIDGWCYSLFIDGYTYILQYDFAVGGGGSSKTYTLYRIDGQESGNSKVGAYSSDLTKIVSAWYYRLLIIAIIGMMSVLVYIGIRILLSSTSSSQKAKYKQMLGDWFVGMILLFTMHYIMSFSNMFVDRITDLFGNINPKFYYEYIEQDEDNKIEKALTDSGFHIDTSRDIDLSDPHNVWKTVETDSETGKSSTYFVLQAKNLMGKLRYDVTYDRKGDEAYIGYTVLYVMMVVYLFIYVIMYFRRLIYMAFLTMIAPLVALTYPIDKVNDGKAQGFNIWFKEYIFNLLIQPLHLLLYTILISSAINLALENPVYAIVVMGFMSPAEKILRKMFNFEKASTPGVFGGAAGGALIMSGMRWLMGHGPKGGRQRDGKNNGGSDNGLKSDVTSNGISTMKGINEFGNPSDGGQETQPILENIPPTSDDNSQGRTFTNGDNTGWYSQGTNNGSSSAQTVQNKPENNSQPRVTTVPEIPDVPVVPNRNNNNNSKRRIGSAVATYPKTYFGGKANRLARRIEKSNPGRFVAKTGLRLAGGAALGMVGLAAGAASGDLGKTGQYTVAGLAGGLKLGGDSYDTISDIIGGREAEDAAKIAEREYLGEEEFERREANKRQRLEMQKEENIRLLQQKLKINGEKMTRKQAQERLEQIIPYYYNNKITTDINEMIKIEKTKEKFFKDDPNGRDKAAWGQQFYKQYGYDSKLSEKKREESVKRALEQYKNVKGVNEAMIRQAFDWADKYTITNDSM